MNHAQSSDEIDDNAGEYVLGTLTDSQRAEFEATLAVNPAAEQAVYAWQDRLLALSTRVPPVQPHPQLWPRIDAALIPSPIAARRTSPALGGVAHSWWQRLPFWQGLSLAAVAAAITVSTLLVQRINAPAEIRYIAVLQSPDQQSAGWVVELNDDRLRLVPAAKSGPVPAGRSLQFWTKPQGAVGPTSLGLVQAGRIVELPLPRLKGSGEQQLFEITLEPEGGSTIGRPTGPILYVGRTIAL